jgi:hypothetical protein
MRMWALSWRGTKPSTLTRSSISCVRYFNLFTYNFILVANTGITTLNTSLTHVSAAVLLIQRSRASNMLLVSEKADEATPAV